MEGTKNDVAWEKIFFKYNVLNKIENEGFFEIKSEQINEFRESRLMAKFDHEINLPNIFKDNRLSILPISRSSYVIGSFQTYEKITYQNKEPIIVEPLDYQSIEHTNLYSENSSLLYAFNSGIISDLVGEDVALTLTGRMSSSNFYFEILNSVKGNTFPINVQNAQIEIDAGFEGDSSLVLVEAKNTQVDDFLIRQVYYPYRLWENKVDKDIINVFMTYSNDIFSFFLYEFEDKNNYNSLKLLKQLDYMVTTEEIELKDIAEIFQYVKICDEPDVPFPQADKFERVVDLLGLLYERDLTREEITANYEFDVRQTSYYTDAGKYLGLIDKYNDKATREITYFLTDTGKNILKQKYDRKYLALIERILEHEIFNYVFEVSLDEGIVPKISQIKEMMYEKKMGDKYGDAVINRRAQTIRSWINWIFDFPK
jgi:hypothetical protein